jgi:hypothetical protein
MILVLAGIAMFQVAVAQNDGKKITSGTVKYEEKVKLDIHLEGDGAQFSNMLPKERKSNKILVFNQDEALYTNNKDVAEEEDIMSDVEGGGMIQVHMEEPDNRLYTDLKTKKQIEQREFMTRMFMIEGEMEREMKRKFSVLPVRRLYWKRTVSKRLPGSHLPSRFQPVLVLIIICPAWSSRSMLRMVTASSRQPRLKRILVTLPGLRSPKRARK